MNFRKTVLGYLKEHEKLNYAVNCVRYFKNDRFRQAVLEINHDPTTIKYENFGDKNKDELIYLIYPENFALGAGRAVFCGPLSHETGRGIQ